MNNHVFDFLFCPRNRKVSNLFLQEMYKTAFSVTAAKTLNAARACGSTDRRAPAGQSAQSKMSAKVQNLFYVLRKVT